jgi:hypothetical protein
VVKYCKVVQKIAFLTKKTSILQFFFQVVEGRREVDDFSDHNVTLFKGSHFFKCPFSALRLDTLSSDSKL